MKLITLSILFATLTFGCASLQPKPPEEWKRVNLYYMTPVTETNKDGVVEIKEWKYHPAEMRTSDHVTRPLLKEEKK